MHEASARFISLSALMASQVLGKPTGFFFKVRRDRKRNRYVLLPQNLGSE